MPERMGAEQRLPDPMVECCASDTLNYFSHELEACPNSASAGEDISACSRPRGTEMGENLVLLSCGAAFITGIVIAGASLFGG